MNNDIVRQDALKMLLSYCGVPAAMLDARLTDEDNDKGSIFYTGKVGTGKTYKAVALLADWMVGSKFPFERIGSNIVPRYNDAPIFITVPELLLSMRMSFRADSKVNEEAVIAKYADTPFLVLDDMGVEKASEYTLQSLYLLINRRCGNPNLITIITSNLTLDELAAKFNDRIASRINGMCKTVIFKGKDRRM